MSLIHKKYAVLAGEMEKGYRFSETLHLLFFRQAAAVRPIGEVGLDMRGNRNKGGNKEVSQILYDDRVRQHKFCIERPLIAL